MKNIDFTNFVVIESYNKYQYQFGIDYVSKNCNVIDYKKYYKQVKKEFNKYKIEKNITDIDKVRLITDIKRIIDCRCREILNKLGYVKDITSKNYPELVKIPELKNINDLTLISFLLDINLEIILKSRKVRNNTEHEFIVPTFEELKNSLSSCELFLIALKNMFVENRFSCFKITSKESSQIINIIPYKQNIGEYENIGLISLNDKCYDSFSMEYSILLRYIISRNFDNIPRDLFEINRNMPNEKIHCSGLTFADRDYSYDELFFECPFDYI
ncbi:hypothetical protein [Clostridium ganghwense]|uniref:Uncharacterized protein n=1 Tax=Clostridium ganghwense TaxID=312089 RepID=A0ABT4CUQ3_9CLOT|nr:hypothetical protein [Clostridium ganghwense]MCY6372797.1 hypothetical protein [Clostridium ganghwense]